MKIYHKKNFASGLFLILLGIGILAICLREGFDLNGGWRLFLCLFTGGGLLLRSLSREFSREDKLEELDERNRYVAMRSAQRALQITQLACFILAIVCFVSGAPQHSQIMAGVGLGFMFTFMISIFAELFAVRWYEKHC